MSVERDKTVIFITRHSESENGSVSDNVWAIADGLVRKDNVAAFFQLLNQRFQISIIQGLHEKGVHRSFERFDLSWT